MELHFEDFNTQFATKQEERTSKGKNQYFFERLCISCWYLYLKF